MKTHHLLVIEDEEEIASLVCKIASDAGYKPHMALSPEEASGLCEHIDPDVIVLDVLMPDRDGFETMRYISKLANHPQVVILSGQDSYREMADRFGTALGVSIVGNVAKPFRVDELRRMLLGIRAELPPRAVA